MSNTAKKKGVSHAKDENTKELQKIAIVSTIVVIVLLALMYAMFAS